MTADGCGEVRAGGAAAGRGTRRATAFPEKITFRLIKTKSMQYIFL